MNDYSDTDTHDMQFVFALTPEKSIRSTSIADTTDPEITIGEEITYDVRIEIPELALFEDVSFVDTLSEELTFVSLDSQIASGSIMSSV